MDLAEKIQVVQAASNLLLAKKIGIAAMASTHRPLAIQPEPDEIALQKCVELVLLTLGNKGVWPQPNDARFLELNL